MVRTETNARHVYESYCRPWFTACWTLYNIGGLCVRTYRYAQPHTKRTVTTSQPRFFSLLFIYFFYYYYLFFRPRDLWLDPVSRSIFFFFIRFFLLYVFARARDSEKYNSSRTRHTTLGLFLFKNAFFIDTGSPPTSCAAPISSCRLRWITLGLLMY